MKITFNDALKALELGDEQKAWEIAKLDEGLPLDTTKQQWLNYAYNVLAFRKGA